MAYKEGDYLKLLDEIRKGFKPLPGDMKVIIKDEDTGEPKQITLEEFRKRNCNIKNTTNDSIRKID